MKYCKFFVSTFVIVDKKKKKKVRRKWNVISNLNCCTILVSEDRKGWSISIQQSCCIWLNLVRILVYLVICNKYLSNFILLFLTKVRGYRYILNLSRAALMLHFLTVFSSKCWICIIFLVFGFSFTHKKIFKISILQSQIMNLL